MKMFRLLTLLAAGLFAMAALAQQNPPAQENGDHKHGGQMSPGGPGMGNMDDHIKQLSTRLNLTADQQAKVKSIMEDGHQQMEATMKDDSLSKDDKHAKMKTLQESTHSKIRDVLTDEQKPKFDAMVKEMHDRMHAQHAGDSTTK